MIRTAVLTLSLLAFAACTAEAKPEGAPGGAAPTESPSTPPAVSAEVVARLAEFDAKDGATDKVVHKCAGCSLGMDGEDKWPLKVSDYTMHFCKQGCLDKFSKDPGTAILAVKAK